MFYISSTVSVPRSQIEISPIRASGPGGQNVNKVSSAVHLRFDIPASSLPDAIKEKLLQISDRRISSDGVIVIKAQRYRSQEKNIEDGLERLKLLIGKALVVQKKTQADQTVKECENKKSGQ